MTVVKNLLRILFLLVVPAGLFAEGIPYVVEFEGLKNRAALRAIKARSQLTSLKNPPSSLNALRFRAEEDIPEMRKILRALGYYEAKIDIHVQEAFPKARVLVYISSGPLYRIGHYTIHLSSPSISDEMIMEILQLPNIGIYPSMPARSQSIQNAEKLILSELSKHGYPLAKIQNREIVAATDTQSIDVNVYIETGPLSRFGPLSICGNRDVKKHWLENKILWCEGEVYNQEVVDKTQKKLIETGLFSSVLISHGDEPDGDGLIPMELEVGETLHKNISAGVSYQTTFGLGATFGWENRNIGGRGHVLSLQGDVTEISHTGILSYVVPEFKSTNQDFQSQLQALQESIHPTYSKRAYSLTSRIERRIPPYLRMAVGGRIEKMYVTNSLQNGEFLLLQMPLFVGWTNVNNILNPTRGMSIGYNLAPSFNFERFGRWYLEQKLTLGNYLSVFRKNDALVLAQQITFGSILSMRLDDIPIPERFLGGSEDDLRGYSYLTVSPLRRNDHGKRKPLGGRSAVYYTVETRFRLNDNLGLVPFFDLGNVWLEQLPVFHGKWLKSVGLGVRYFTFLGPLRCDIGFPLDRRHGIDHKWRVLVSIGQSF